jgi:PAS domain S-box-containing protein
MKLFRPGQQKGLPVIYLLYSVITLVIFGLLLINVVVNFIWLRPLVSNIRDNVTNFELIQAKRAAESIDRTISREIYDIEILAQNIALLGEKNEISEIFIHRFLRESPAQRELSIINLSGQEEKRYSRSEYFSPEELRDFAFLEEFEKAKQGETYLSYVNFSPHGEPYIIISAPLKKSEERPQAVLRAVLYLKQIWDEVLETKIGKTGRISVIDDKGMLIADPNPSRVLKKVNLLTFPPTKSLILGEIFKGAKYLNEKEVEVIGVGAPIKSLRWGVIVEQDAAELEDPINQVGRLAIIFSIAGIMIIGILIWLALILKRADKELRERYYALSARTKELEEIKGSLEEKVKERTRELEELTKDLKSKVTEIKKFQENLEIKVKERTKELENTRKALINMLEDAEEARKRIEEEKNKTRTTLISLNDGLIVFDKEKRITLLNPEAERILGLKEKQALNKRMDQISGFPNLTRLYQILGQKIEWTGQRYELVLEKPLKRFFQVSITPVAVEKKIVGLMVVLHNITREKEIDRLKTEFVSIAAHQLRTPLSAIKWALRMLLDGDVGELSEEQIKFLEKGYKSNERMIGLINDLLNVARIEEGRFLYNLTFQSLEEIIEKTIATLDELIKVKKLKLVFTKPKSSLPKLKVDGEKIGLVVQNLLDNAIRFNKPGGKVTVAVKCDKMNIEVMIKDTGVGIPSFQQNRIFDKFFRADNAIKSETEGTGLGLFICKNIIEAHGGKIWFESKERQGTTFWFTLPIKSS